MIIDLNKTLETLAANPEVKKAVANLREKGVADALVTLGLGSRSSVFGASIVSFAAGAIVGAGAAMLLTPRTGEAFRKDVSEFMSSLRERAQTTATEIEHKAEAKKSRVNDNGRAHSA
jgi:tryptophan synthase alpha subunit